MFLKLTDASGQLIKGDATAVGFERPFMFYHLPALGKQYPIKFHRECKRCIGRFKKAMANGSLLQNGAHRCKIISGGKPAISYS